MTIAPAIGSVSKKTALRGGFLWSARCWAQRADFVIVEALAFFLPNLTHGLLEQISQKLALIFLGFVNRRKASDHGIIYSFLRERCS